MKIRFAVAPGPGPFAVDQLDALLSGCEQLGFDTVWLSDVPLGSLGDPLVSLTYAAGRTQRLKLGANVVPFGRHPMLLARELAQLDQVSRGRLLLSFVPGLNASGESRLLGAPGTARGRHDAMEEIIGLVRRFWTGAPVSHDSERFWCESLSVTPVPLQQPLEIWLGGYGAEALERTGRIADGWLTAAVSPAEAERGRRTIEAAAARAGRHIDPEHFGISMPYARVEPDASVVAALRARRPDVDPTEVLAVGAEALVALIRRHLDAGLSKFVLRPVTPAPRVGDELAWLAEVVLSLQT
jgi:probable F420-dependent oxidoreductase